ncbi:CHAT domain-containing protein [Crucibulum laeve]|uniref:CHAT domain-containing protein n=1 Tax=Crucibulum laeve TaxID=68775 RepID=A0A5C3M1V6_9AGAR|nr:CHAT domain-containing protein [Crucibulum laeve]
MHDTDLLVSAKFVVQNSRIYCPQSLHPQFLHLEALVSTAEIIGADSCNIQDILSAISVEEAALKLVPDKSVYRPSFMLLLGVLFYEKFCVTQDTADLKSSIQMLKESIALLLSTCPYLPFYQLELGKALQLYARKLNLPKLLLEAIHILKTAATSKLASFKFQYIAGIKWAEACEERNDPETLAAYEFILDVLPKIGSLGLDIQKRHQTLVSMPSGIAGNAAAYAIQCGLIEKAVEFLEHGRFIFWQKAAQLRAPLAELENSRPELARRLKIVTRDLNISGFRMLVDEDSKAYSDFISRESYKRQALSDEWEQLLSEINTIPGYEDFLMARPYSQLCKAATGRIIAILTVTEKSCHAIILRSATSSAKNMLYILYELWIYIVKPVFDFLELKKSNNPPNITWCCSDILSLLPIHAAGIYSGITLENASDFAISSYIPSLSSLLPPSKTSIKEGRILLACLENAPGLPPLPNVLLELQVVRDILSVNAPSTTFVSLEDNKATCNNVLENMTVAHIVHLACHGTSMNDPLESSIILYDGSLKVDKLMRTPFPNARLVFLSACQTAQINPSEPDEYIHIAAAMLFAGFESVIGTMWSINDGDAPIVAKSFYQNLIKDGKIQFSNTSLALHNAIKDLRESGTSPLQWVPFVHIGM